MKKIVLYVLILVLLTFIIPSLFTKVTVESTTFVKGEIPTPSVTEDISEQHEQLEQQNQPENIDLTPYNYKEYGTIKLLHSKTNTVQELPLDEYLLRRGFS